MTEESKHKLVREFVWSKLECPRKLLEATGNIAGFSCIYRPKEGNIGKEGEGPKKTRVAREPETRKADSDRGQNGSQHTYSQVTNLATCEWSGSPAIVATPAWAPYPRALRDSSEGMITAGDTAANRYPARGGAQAWNE